jgi:type II secretory pathway component PulL
MMKTSAFIDITGKNEGHMYLFDSVNSELIENVLFSLDDEYGFHAGEMPGDIADCCLSVPVDMLNCRIIDLPLGDKNRIRDVLPFELEDLMLEKPSMFVIDAVILETLDDRQRALAVYIEKDALRHVLKGMDEIGLDPRMVTSIDIGLLAESTSSGEELAASLLKGPVEGPEGNEQRIRQARREMSDSTINLRRDEFSYTKETEKTRRLLRLSALLAILLALVIAGDIALKTVRTNKEITRIENSILKTYSGLFPEEKTKDIKGISYKLRSHANDLKARKDALSGVSPLEFLMKLEGIKPASIDFSDISLDMQFVTLKGEAKSLSDVDRLKSDLESFLEEVSISGTEQSVDNMIVFTVTAKAGHK